MAKEIKLKVGDRVRVLFYGNETKSPLVGRVGTVTYVFSERMKSGVCCRARLDGDDSHDKFHLMFTEEELEVIE